MPKEEELIFCVLFCGTLFVFLLFFFLSIVINCVSFTTSDYPFMSCDLRLLITRLCPVIYDFWLPVYVLWFTTSDYRLCPVIYDFWLPVYVLWFTTSDYPFMSCDIRLLITRLISIVTLFLYNIHFYQKCRECICTLCDARVIYRRNFRGKIEIFETALKTCMHSSMSAYVCAVWRAI
jgi:hypothetical protein